MQMKYPAELELFHICALQGEKAAGDIMHESWSASGMNIVKTKILDFMVREKYFTLSEALNEKFHEALNGIDFCLSEELKTFQAPVELLQREYDEILDQSIKLKRIMDKEIALVSIEEDAVIKFLDEQVTSDTSALLEELAKEFDSMISKSPLKPDTIKTLSNVFTNIVLVKIEKFYSDKTYSCNKPVRKAIQIHTHEFNQFMESFKKILYEKNAESIRIQEKLEQCELSFEVWKIDGIIDCTITSEWNDRLRNRGALVDRYKKQFESLVGVVVSEQLIAIKSAIGEQLNISFKKMHDCLEKEYGALIRLLEVTLKKKDTAIQEKKSNGGTQCTLLQESAEEFNTIRKMLS